MITSTVQRQIWHTLQVTSNEEKDSPIFDAVDIFLLALIFLNGLAFILDTVADIHSLYGVWINAFETFSIIVFTIEYLLRVWACVVDPQYAHPLWGRLRYMRTPMAIIDLMAVLPFYLPFVDINLSFVRVLRLMRLFRVAKLSRYLEGLQLLTHVVRSKREDLILTLTVIVILLTITSSLMYYAEHEVQPDKFADIPSTMWWSVATLTTVGYGDLYPISAAGKALGAVVAILGIGLFALPTAILGTGYIEAMTERKEREAKKTSDTFNTIERDATPEISRFYGITIRMFDETGERNHIPHVHAYYQDSRAVYRIAPVERLDGDLPSRQRRLVEAWLELYQDELLDTWQLIIEGQPIHRLPPLRRS